MPSGDSISFEGLWNSACVVSGNLKRMGLAVGDRVIIMVPMSIDLYVTLLAVVKIGAVAVFVDPWIPARRMAAFASFAEPAAFIGVGKSHWLRLMESRLRKIRLTVTTGSCVAGIPARYRLRKLKHGQPDTQCQGVNPDDPALITFTSGSSGEPKGANRTHRFLAAQHRALRQEFHFEPTDVDMPMFPIFALNNLVSGITSVVPDMDFRKVADVDGQVIARQLVRHSVTTCTVSPPLIDRLCDELEVSKPELKPRRVLTGGAPVSDSQLKRWRKAFPETRFVIAYGSTEAEPVSHISLEERLSLDTGASGYCVGHPSRLIRARVIRICKSVSEKNDESLEQLTLNEGETGELVVCGEHVCRDYYRNPRATAENKLRDTGGEVWHRMGDTGRFDSQGRFWLAGRVHSTVIRNGVAIHPQLVEQQITRSITGIDQVATLGMPDPQLGQACWIVVNTNSDSQDIEDRIEALLEHVSIPCDRIVVMDELLPVDPRHNSKIDYGALRERLQAERR